MVKHVILWSLRDDLTAAEKESAKLGIKTSLEALQGKIQGLINIKVNINGLETSTADVMLDSSFESAEALAAYSKHPDHVAAANKFVRPFTKSRSCLDFEG